MNKIFDDALIALKPAAALCKGFRSAVDAIDAQDQDRENFAVLDNRLHRLHNNVQRELKHMREDRDATGGMQQSTAEYHDAKAAFDLAAAKYKDLKDKAENPAPIPECTKDIIGLLRKIRSHLEEKISSASSVRAEAVATHQAVQQRFEASAAMLAKARVSQALGESAEPVQADPEPENPAPMLAEFDQRIKAMQAALSATDSMEHRMIAEVASADLTTARHRYETAASELLSAAVASYALGSIYHEHLNLAGRKQPGDWLSRLFMVKVPELHSNATLTASDHFASAIDAYNSSLMEAGIII
jgi:hypothetical protein